MNTKNLFIIITTLFTSSSLFSTNTVISNRILSVQKNCVVWDTDGLVLRDNGVSVTLGKQTMMCYRGNGNIYRYATHRSTFKSVLLDRDAIVAFAEAKQGEDCLNKIDPFNYSQRFYVGKDETFKHDIDAFGRGGTYDKKLTDSFCARLFTTKPE